MDGQHPLHRVLLAYAERQLPRVLTQMDRDPDSPTRGNFDRNGWHYKIRDFSSAILQQGVTTLEALRCGDLPLPPGASLSLVERWAQSAVIALGSLVRRDGSVDEYYPYERSFPAASFALGAAVRALASWQREAPHLLEGVPWKALARMAAALDARREVEATNQQAAGLAALAQAARLSEIVPAPKRVAEHADRLFAAQNSEGWFDEYGGPDFGYLAVTIDALVDYADATGDARAEVAIDRAVEFLASLVGADGRLPSTLNSRNTDYVVPYGLVRAGARNPLAAWLVTTLFHDADCPEHFLWATDDRYTTHYLYASVVRALPHIAKMLPPQAPMSRREIWWPEAGYWIRWKDDRTESIAIGARKGGLVRIHRRADPPVLDHGWRIRTAESKLFTSNWWSEEWKIEKSENELRLEGPCRKGAFHLSKPWKHALLRIAAWTFGRHLLGPLRKLLIFRPRRGAAPYFSRSISFEGGGMVTVTDVLTIPSGAEAVRGPRQNLRHVASAESFHAEDLMDPIAAEISKEVSKENGPHGSLIRSSWRWPQA